MGKNVFIDMFFNWLKSGAYDNIENPFYCVLFYKDFRHCVNVEFLAVSDFFCC